MKMYCKKCCNDVKIKKKKSKDKKTKTTNYRCKYCEALILTIIENRRKDIR